MHLANFATLYIIDWLWSEWTRWTDCWKVVGPQTMQNYESKCERKRSRICNIVEQPNAGNAKSPNHKGGARNCNKYECSSIYSA